ncbi:YbaB/EbfC family nucleoid-associated protein [Mycoplasmopsis gallinacea]|uniref:Nucleoid-associated protein GOQ20_00600 n=1 Tax=Mycoplasmopsis gallinacea TaxID=29556 RepID=A0A449A2Z7_9BACT|nr:YbaB/EbfC family nucleoid-associated protein [Mycoplasmopsis gallinacea]QIW61973.1 YbaB/EbfC family nucleoid-associated protein [Mycoplasmopsis gallinacea]VEU58621.1 UPF0133 protein MALL_0399 [Mycoplasmopsis gallinacea]
MFSPNMLKQMKKMQKELEEKQAAFEEKEFSAEKYGVKVVVSGAFEVKSVTIDPELLEDGDVESLQDVFYVVLNEVLQNIKDEQAELTPQMPSGMPF